MSGTSSQPPLSFSIIGPPTTGAPKATGTAKSTYTAKNQSVSSQYATPTSSQSAISPGVNTTYAWAGLQRSTSSLDDLTATMFIIESFLNTVSTATLVKVQACTNTPGATSPVGRVNVLPLVNQLNGHDQPTPHITVYNLCYFRLGGGNNAILLDPQPGDVGLAVFADRDISAVKNSGGQQSNPGSRRRWSYSDGIYFGLSLANAPQQYVSFNNDGITVVDKNHNTVTLSDSGISIVDRHNNNITTSSSGINLVDTNNNNAVMSSSGINLTDKFGNYVQMESAGIHFHSTGIFTSNVELTVSGP
jgi:hypothetical protein